MTVPAPDLSSVVRRIGSLFERAYAIGAERPTRSEVEELLTEGYAHALALESERARIERRMSELVGRAERRGAAYTAHELRRLSARHGELDRNVLWLRGLLGELQEYGSGQMSHSSH